MALHAVYPERYQEQLDEKVASCNEIFSDFKHPALDVYDSPSSHYRMRAEFKIWHSEGTVNYAMFEPGVEKKPYVINAFPVASENICTLMPKLLLEINNNEMLKQRLFQVEFLSTLSGDTLITLIYHKRLDEHWKQAAIQLQSILGTGIIGRCKGQKHVLLRDHVWECMQVAGRAYHYQQPEGAFSQPNGVVCEKMLNWAVECAEDLHGDLLELYCGNGNFTLPLSSRFEKVLATEISKTSVNAAKANITKNQISNIEIIRMSSEEFSSAMQGDREFRRLKNIDLQSYNFSTVFVDPPRAGLDSQTEKIVQGFDNIIYVSCNPETLKNNLTTLTQTHSIERAALFDQFPYTHHVECGVLLKKK